LLEQHQHRLGILLAGGATSFQLDHITPSIGRRMESRLGPTMSPSVYEFQADEENAAKNDHCQDEDDGKVDLFVRLGGHGGGRGVRATQRTHRTRILEHIRICWEEKRKRQKIQISSDSGQ